jgi:hypothetical protein
MGYEYYILKPKDHTWFHLGKGDYSKPLEEFAKWDSDAIQNAKTNTEQMLAHKGDFNRSMMASDVDEFVELYVAGIREGFTDETYVRDLAKKLWDWLGEDDVWLYGDHVFEVYNYSEWKETGTRYVE